MRQLRGDKFVFGKILVQTLQGGKNVRFPARCVETLHGQGCEEAKRNKNLVIIFENGDIFGKFLSINLFTTEFGPSNFLPPPLVFVQGTGQQPYNLEIPHSPQAPKPRPQIRR